jgi:putative NADH-flavin reductase
VVAQADARDQLALTAAFAGAQAVVSCLGHVARDTNRHSVLQEGAKALVGAMAEAEVTRVVAISAAAAVVADDDPLSRFVIKPLLGRMLRNNYEDTRAMEQVIRGSGTDWTLLRPSRLVARAGGTDYRSRLDTSIRWRYWTTFDTVGRAAIDAINNPAWVGHAVFITE